MTIAHIALFSRRMSDESRSAKAQPIHLRLSEGRQKDELYERPLEGTIGTARLLLMLVSEMI